MSIESLNEEIIALISEKSLMSESGRRSGVYDLFKWFGRRYSILIRSLLASLILDISGIEQVILSDNEKPLKDAYNKTILDPFCGSGIIPFEARKLGFNSICIDINPAAIALVRATYNILTHGCAICECLKQALITTFNELKNLWCTDEWCFVHVFAVRCPPCKAPMWLSKIRSHNSGDNGEVFILFNGKDLEYVKSSNNIKPTYPSVELNPQELVRIGKDVYGYAAEIITTKGQRVFVSLVENNEYRLKLLESIILAKKYLEKIPVIYLPIPEGKEIKRLKKSAIVSFHEIFSPRQLLSLYRFLLNASKYGCANEAAMITASVMRTASFLAFYYQPYAKVNPGLVIKSFWLPEAPVELNPLLYVETKNLSNIKSIGRGTIASYVAKCYRICRQEGGSKHTGLISLIRDNALSIDKYVKDTEDVYAVITDPPYFGRQRYWEMTVLHLYSLRLLGYTNVFEWIKEDINTYSRTKYVSFMKAFASKVYRVLRRDGYLIIIFGVPSSYNEIRILTNVVKSIINKGFGLRAIYSFLGEAPGVMGRSKIYSIIIHVFKRDSSNNIGKRFLELNVKAYKKLEETLKSTGTKIKHLNLQLEAYYTAKYISYLTENLLR